MLDEKFYCADLQKEDYANGFLECLEQLTEVGSISKEDFHAQFNKIFHCDSYKIITVKLKETGKIVGVGTIFYEKKFIHKNGLKGHIEDIVVLKAYRGNGIGKYIISKLIEMGKNRGCYKVILTCKDENIEFYKKCGLEPKEREMAIYFK